MTKQASPKKPLPKPKADETPLYTLSYLAAFFDLDRAVLRKRLDEAGVKPKKESAKRKEYDLSEVEAALEVENELDNVKLRKLTAEAELQELRLQRERDETLTRKEVEDYAQKLFTALFQRLCVRLPREIASQLFKAESTPQLTKQLSTHISTVFNEIREDHTRLFSRD